MKLNPNKSCGCRMCKAGRSTAGGRSQTHAAEKAFRQKARIALTKDPLNYVFELVPTGYTD